MGSDKTSYRTWHDKLFNAISALRPDTRVLLEGITKSIAVGQDKVCSDEFDDDMVNELCNGQARGFNWKEFQE